MGLTLDICFASHQNIPARGGASLVSRTASAAMALSDMYLLTSRTLKDQLEPVMRCPRDTRSKAIGVLCLDPSLYGKATLLAGIQQATRESDYCVCMVTSRVPSREALPGAVQTLRSLEVAGLLVLAPRVGEIEMLAGVAGEIPLVALEAPQQDVLCAVTSDHYAAGAAATRHLLELDHQSVFHIAGPADGPEPRSRLTGWRDALRAAGADVPGAMIGDGSPEGGYELGRTLAMRGDVTAVFVATDQMALGVLHAMSEARRRVPAEVSVVGCGGTPEAEFFNPPLTTIRQNFTEIGRRGAELLQAGIEAGRLAVVEEVIPAELIVRASTGAAA
jgi:DNA-binding LacI/PurR family transcriptional regulator